MGRFSFGSWLFLRVLGLVYALAFASLAVQVLGLIGADGILPAAQTIEILRARLEPPRGVEAPLGKRSAQRAEGERRGSGSSWLGGWDRVHAFPTLFWLGASDGLLVGLAWLGAALGVLLMAGVAPIPLLLALWALYLSFVVVGRDFLAFQWDNLLLEVGLLAVLLAPPVLFDRRSRPREPPRVAVVLLWFMLFRLVFSSGVVKLASGDPTWRDLSALSYHYYTQPLPNRIAWWVHQLPASIHQASVAVTFAIQLGAPFLIFAPRKVRHLAAIPLLLEQGAIAFTGNYGFFNLLSASLCLLLLDDALLRRAVEGARAPRGWRIAVGVLAAPFVLAGTLVLARTLGVSGTAGETFLGAVGPFRSVNGYGLFAVMTTERDELELEGSDDGVTWKRYRLPWKPSRLDEAPKLCAPHMPRLDWQMWFAALGSPRHNRWFAALVERLLEGSPDVRALFAEDPFPDHPPRFVRALRFEYHFTTIAERRETGAWWRADPRPDYFPPTSL